MNTHVLLFQLRERLRLVERRLEDVAHVQPSSGRYLYAGGQQIELRSEQTFLTDLIADLEREGVQS